MQIQNTNDGYIAIISEEREQFDLNQIRSMNNNRFILPSMRDRYDQKTILFYQGEYIRLSQYLVENKLGFTEFKNIIIKCIDCFIALEKDQYIVNNILPTLEHIFINVRTMDIKVIYCPMEFEIGQGSFITLLNNLSYESHTYNAGLLLGTLIEESHSENVNLEEVRQHINGLQEQRVQMQAAKVAMEPVQKPQPVPAQPPVIKIDGSNQISYLEKVIKVRVTLSSLLSIAVFAVAMILVPLILYKGFDNYDFYINTMDYVMFGVATTISLVIWLLVLLISPSTKNMESPSFATMEQMEANVRPVHREPVKQPLPAVTMTSKQAMQQPVPQQPMFTKPPVQEEENGTTVLSYEDDNVCAYITEQGKTSIMDRIYIDKDQFVIGRTKESDYAVNDIIVSKQHAVITRINGEFYITDLNSSNHTYVNGMQLTPNEQVLLQDHAAIRFGNKEYLFCRGK